MKFRQFVPEYSPSERKSFEIRQYRDTPEGNALRMQVRTENSFIRMRQPFYRLYPGVTEALTRLGIEKIDISKIRPPVNPLSLEFPVDRPLIAGSEKVVNILFMDFEDDNGMFVEYRSSLDAFGVMTFPRDQEHIMGWLDKSVQDEKNGVFRTLLQIVFGVCMIPQSDSSLITPRVLNRDQEKYEETGDMKYVDRARRNGVNGWDVGRDIPTPEEMESFRQQSCEPGRKSPHWRMGHFAIRHTGEGRTETTIVWIGDTFVNKKLLKEVPTGYHGSSEPSNN
jgi:hypothetical protein